MKLSELSKTTKKSHKRIGRGHGSGRGGHTSTRGSKGQKSRSKIGLFFEGTKVKKSLIKRLPFLRGKGKFNPSSRKPLVINIKYLNLYKAGEEVSILTLKEKGILPKEANDSFVVKILGDGEINIPLTTSLLVSKGARIKIEKAGGKIITEKVVKKVKLSNKETK